MATFLCSSDVCLLYPAPDSMPLCTHTYNSNQGTFDRERRHLINKLGVVGQDCPEKPGIYNHPGNITSFLSVLLKSHLLYQFPIIIFQKSCGLKQQTFILLPFRRSEVLTESYGAKVKMSAGCFLLRASGRRSSLDFFVCIPRAFLSSWRCTVSSSFPASVVPCLDTDPVVEVYHIFISLNLSQVKRDSFFQPAIFLGFPLSKSLYRSTGFPMV